MAEGALGALVGLRAGVVGVAQPRQQLVEPRRARRALRPGARSAARGPCAVAVRSRIASAAHALRARADTVASAIRAVCAIRSSASSTSWSTSARSRMPSSRSSDSASSASQPSASAPRSATRRSASGAWAFTRSSASPIRFSRSSRASLTSWRRILRARERLVCSVISSRARCAPCSSSASRLADACAQLRLGDRRGLLGDRLSDRLSDRPRHLGAGRGDPSSRLARARRRDVRRTSARARPSGREPRRGRGRARRSRSRRVPPSAAGRRRDARAQLGVEALATLATRPRRSPRRARGAPSDLVEDRRAQLGAQLRRRPCRRRSSASPETRSMPSLEPLLDALAELAPHLLDPLRDLISKLVADRRDRRLATAPERPRARPRSALRSAPRARPDAGRSRCSSSRASWRQSRQPIRSESCDSAFAIPASSSIARWRRPWAARAESSSTVPSTSAVIRSRSSLRVASISLFSAPRLARGARRRAPRPGAGPPRPRGRGAP